jgi:hypothetical protein
MTIKASGRSALIVATGLWVCLVGPAAAADGAASSKSQSAIKYAKHVTPHWKRVAYRKSGRPALKSSAASKAVDVAVDVADDTIENSAALPPSVANANAQLASADSPAGSARAMSTRASTILQAAPDNPTANAQAVADTQVVAADQLNDVDRALQDSKAPSALNAMASADAPAAAPVTASRQESSTWDQTSLIGKIFIGFGALLTMASAARMFMA